VGGACKHVGWPVETNKYEEQFGVSGKLLVSKIKGGVNGEGGKPRDPGNQKNRGKKKKGGGGGGRLFFLKAKNGNVRE